MARALTGAAVVGILLLGVAPQALTIETIRSTGGLPPHIVALFEDPLAFQQTPGGPYYVFDRRGHSVYAIHSDKKSAFKLVEIGPELGRILQPRGFDTSATGSFVVADAPRTLDRVQIFGGGGLRTGGFTLPAREHAAAIEFGTRVMSGIGAIQYAGANLLISHPESGSLFTEYSPGGFAQRSYGRLRATGQEQDREVHMALNVGLPLPDPTGGFYYVFVGGRPMFHKYDVSGRLLFERHIEGAELDPYLATLPTRWPRRRIEDRELPLVHPAIRAAAVDPQGRLWISLMEPYTYVYDPRGDKIRTVQLQAAGIVAPSSLFFTADGRLLITPGCFEFRP